jgi:hypothetical protein
MPGVNDKGREEKAWTDQYFRQLDAATLSLGNAIGSLIPVRKTTKNKIAINGLKRNLNAALKAVDEMEDACYELTLLEGETNA